MSNGYFFSFLKPLCSIKISVMDALLFSFLKSLSDLSNGCRVHLIELTLEIRLEENSRSFYFARSRVCEIMSLRDREFARSRVCAIASLRHCEIANL